VSGPIVIFSAPDGLDIEGFGSFLLESDRILVMDLRNVKRRFAVVERWKCEVELSLGVVNRRTRGSLLIFPAYYAS